VPQPKVDRLRALLPDPGTDVAQLFRDEDLFASTAEAVAGLFDPDVESVPAWRGAGTTYSGIDGSREIVTMRGVLRGGRGAARRA
jgi:hypothetical protein